MITWESTGNHNDSSSPLSIGPASQPFARGARTRILRVWLRLQRRGWITSFAARRTGATRAARQRVGCRGGETSHVDCGPGLFRTRTTPPRDERARLYIRGARVRATWRFIRGHCSSGPTRHAWRRRHRKRSLRRQYQDIGAVPVGDSRVNARAGLSRRADARLPTSAMDGRTVQEIPSVADASASPAFVAGLAAFEGKSLLPFCYFESRGSVLGRIHQDQV